VIRTSAAASTATDEGCLALPGTVLAPALVRAAEGDGAPGVAASLDYFVGAAAVFGPVMLPLGLLAWVLTSPLAVLLLVLLMVLFFVGASRVLFRVSAALNGGQVPGSLLHVWLIDVAATRLCCALRPGPAERQRQDRSASGRAARSWSRTRDGAGPTSRVGSSS
jgi:hypothetical protein